MPQLFASFPLKPYLKWRTTRVPVTARGRILCLTLGPFKFRGAAQPSLCHVFPRITTLGITGPACHSAALIGMFVKFFDRVHVYILHD
jgi:hypothetical protein